MPNPGAKLRALIDKGEHFVCGDTFSAITGRRVSGICRLSCRLPWRARVQRVPLCGARQRRVQPGRADRAGQPHRQRDEHPADRRCRHAGRDGGRRLPLHPPLHPAGHRRLPCRGRAQSQPTPSTSTGCGESRTSRPASTRRGARRRIRASISSSSRAATSSMPARWAAAAPATGTRRSSAATLISRPAPTCCTTRPGPLGGRSGQGFLAQYQGRDDGLLGARHRVQHGDRRLDHGGGRPPPR